MPQYAIHDESGKIIRTVTCDASLIDLQCAEGEHWHESDAMPHDSLDPVTKEVIKGEPLKLKEQTKPQREPWAELRSKSYPSVAEQFDLLWHDIDEGVFGEGAKQSKFFQRIKIVKDVIEKRKDIDPALVYFMETLPAASERDPNLVPEDRGSSSARFKHLKELAYSRKVKEAA